MLKKNSSFILFSITIIIAISYLFLSYTGLNTNVLFVLGTVWNFLLSALAGDFLLKTEFLSQFKHGFESISWTHFSRDGYAIFSFANSSNSCGVR